jgi:hypothetical protein
MQEQIMTKRRWLKSVIAASQAPTPAMPFQRANRRKPTMLKSAASGPSTQQGTTVNR